MFVLHAFVLVKWKERSCGLPVHHKKRTHSYTRVGECVLFLVTACEEIIAKDKTGNNNQDGKKTVAHKKHNAHTDTNPKQNKANQPFHDLPPGKELFDISICNSWKKFLYCQICFFSSNSVK